MMDIKELAKVNEPSNTGVWVDIKHPASGDKLPIRFKILGASSDEYFKLRDKLQTEMLTASMDGKEYDNDEMGLRLVAGLVVGIEGLEANGTPLTDAMQVFKTDGLRFIFHQLDIEVKKKANFLPPASAK